MPDASRNRPRLNIGGIRAAAALVATLVVTAALGVGAILLVSLTRTQLARSVETNVVIRAQDLAQLVTEGGVPQRLPATRGESAQIIDADGRVLVSTPDIEGQGPITSLIPDIGEVTTVRVSSLDVEEGGGGESDEGPFLAAVKTVDSASGVLAVVVARSLAAVENTTSTLIPLLVGGIPLLALVVAATTWLLAGRTLKPVRAMTEEADRITLTDLGRRIPLPGSSDEIRQLAETLNRMLNRLDTEVARQRRFVADASHELKSPVAALLTMAEVSVKHPDRINPARLAADVATEARRLALLVDDLLALARSDEGAFALEPLTFDLAQLVAEETARFAAQGGIQLNLDGVSSTTITADPRRIGQVIRNLADNAVRHARQRVWIETRTVDGWTELSIADDGPGIAPADRHRVFERFVRLDEARSRSHGGTGLGLAVVQVIVQAHGGIAEIVDDPRFKGAVVRVRLPTQPR